MTREFVFLPEFEKQWKKLGLTDDDQKDLEAFLCEYPESGDLIQGTGGLRKLRWALPSTGKSGGARVLYIDFAFFETIYMVTCFGKSTKVNLTQDEKKQIKGLVEQLKSEQRRKPYERKK
jgi:hypothetical protein